MRRRVDRPFIIPRRTTASSSSWNRGRQPGLPVSSQSHPRPNSLIDEKLIEGAQISSFFSQFQRQESQPYQHPPTSTQFQFQSQLQLPGSLVPRKEDGEEEAFEDEDVQLDSFDLELLAQSGDKPSTYQSYAPDNAKYFQSYNGQMVEPSTQASRFFNGSQATPHQSIASSSSDIDVRDVSSPLARLQSGRAGRPTRGYDLETQSSITQAFQPQSILEPPSYHDQETPFKNIPASIRGIVLLSVHELPDKYRTLFPFPVFNAVQSKCFTNVYKSDDNVVLAAPTGSGKTVIMELAICRLLNTLKEEQFKVVYQAPTKSLCYERFCDWSRKFQVLGLQCAELTGDTDHNSSRNVQNSQIIITTPEKWDSMTRKWKDHARLMQLVKLFLIDEVHTLKEARGATMEAVVSRMKTIGSNVRFVALSATIPNSDDIASWLGRSATSQHVPAHREHFGEEFRPVKLRKFVYGYQSHGNDFAFDKLLNSKLAEVIRMHSAKKPIMIFCCTRNSAVTTAKELAKLWSMSNHPARLWKGPNKPMPVSNADLKTTTITGVAFHHAGLEPSDRHQVEKGYLEGKISIICCTSTLAVGVNLPCHLVIIKNTVGWQDGCCQEYSDLEVMQMLGRAGRPQFDDSAVAVILTRKERVKHYERLVSGSESLESCLHLNLIDHLNAEIGLGNVTSVESAAAWLAGTFLFVRLRRNPTHYKLKEGANRDDEDEMLRQICEKDIKLLQECDLVESNALKSTPLGDAMARYYIRFETMKTLRSLKPKSDVAQVLSILSQADEFREIRLKAGERSVYKELNRSPDIRYPINVDIALPAHKISLLIQSELGAVEFPSAEQYQKHRFTFQQDKSFVFSHVNRVIRCIIDCEVHLQDSETTRNALELARSLAARVWDDSPLQMKQIEQIGVVAVRKLVGAGIESLEALEETAKEPHVIEMALSKNPPFGAKLRARLADFPKLRVSVKMAGKEIKPGRSLQVRFKAEIAFMNEKCPVMFQKRPVYVCFIAETSDGRLIDFRRISAGKLRNSHEICLNVELKAHDQSIACHVMCDEIAGTSRSAILRPDLPRSCYPKQINSNDISTSRKVEEDEGAASFGTSEDKPTVQTRKKTLEDYDTDDLLFGDWLDPEILEGWNETDIEASIAKTSKFDSQEPAPKRKEGEWNTTEGSPDIFDDWNDKSLGFDAPKTADITKSSTEALKNKCIKPNRSINNEFSDQELASNTQSLAKATGEEGIKSNTATKSDAAVAIEPERLDNGRWACNHKCKDKTTCKHLCCRDGLDNPPRSLKRKPETINHEGVGSKQLKLSANITKPKNHPPPDIDEASKKLSKNKHGLSSSTWEMVQQLSGSQSKAASTDKTISLTADSSSDYGGDSFDDVPSPLAALLGIDDGPPDYISERKNITAANQSAFEPKDGCVEVDNALFPMCLTDEVPLTTNYGSAEDCPSDLVSSEQKETPNSSSNLETCRGQKRKSADEGRILSLTESENAMNKRAKSREEQQDLEDKLLNEGQRDCAKNGKRDEIVTPLVVDNALPAGWEGIDPALLEDFKDIVDFF